MGLYKKLGFKEEGVLRDNYFHEGKYGNSYMLSVLENEWLGIHGSEMLWRVDSI